LLFDVLKIFKIKDLIPFPFAPSPCPSPHRGEGMMEKFSPSGILTDFALATTTIEAVVI